MVSANIARSIYRFSQFNRAVALPSKSTVPLNRFLTSTVSHRYSEASTSPPNTEQAEKTEEQKHVEELTLKNEDLAKEIEEFKDKYRRLLADRENDRVRKQKEVGDAKLFGIQSFSKSLLEISDVFEKALDSVKKEELAASEDEKLKTLYSGLTMTESQMISVFKRHGLCKLPLQLGDAFDPTVHEAMMEVPAPSDAESPGTVAYILRTGWKLNDRCIRAAQVGVYKH